MEIECVVKHMRSVTKTLLSKDQINDIIQNAFQEQVIAYHEVHNGFYNAIYKVTLSNRNVYIKIAPDSRVDILTYEKDIIQREAKLNKIFQALEIPGSVMLYEDFTKHLIPNDYYIMSEVQGKTIFELKDDIKDKKPYYKELMKFLAILHNYNVDSFGYDNQEEHFDTYCETICYMFDNVVKDAKRKDVELHPFMYDIIKKVHTYKDVLNQCTTPSILHFDAWDGNIMVDDNHITALIDNERSFNGPRIADFVPLSFNIFDEEYKDLIHEYNKYSDTTITLSKNDRIIYYIHKAYLFLIMYVECAYRDIEGSFDWQKQWSYETLLELNEKL
jgi:aminoglycoside phosphotransferase (APT) family kinase protein